MGALPRPKLPHGPVRVLSEELHELHHRAGWPSLREMAKEVGCSHTTVSAAFSEPRVPRWGLLELIVEALGGDTGEFHRLWLAASRGPDPAAPPDAEDTDGTAPGVAVTGVAVTGVAAPGVAAPEPAPAPGPPRELPADVVAFTGRTEQIAALDALLARSATAPALTIAAVTGTAGVGKTALAVHWAHRVADRFPDGQLYVNLRGYDPDQPLAATQALEGFLRVLDAPGRAVPPGLPERAARFRTLLADRRCLVLLDNAHSVEQVRDLLPGPPSSFVVVTSRDTLPALVARHGATRLDLDLLETAEAHALLHTLIGSRVDADPATAQALARHCARLPLAMRIAAELAAARPRTPLADLVEELADEPRRLDLLAAGDDDHTAVRTVLSWSLRHVTADAARAFALLGVHPGPDLDHRGVAALTGTDPVTARRLIDVLARAHLLDHVGADRVGMHDLLRAYAAEQAGQLDEGSRRAALDRLLGHYLATARAAVRVAFPGAAAREQPAGTDEFTGAAAALSWLDSERPNLLATARVGNPFTVELSAVVAPYLDACAHYHDALLLHGLAHEAARAGADAGAEGRAATRLCTVHRRLGDYRTAIEHGERALVLLREVGDRASLGVTQHQLGLAYWRTGRNVKAVTCLEHALAGYRRHGDEGGAGAAEYALGLTRFQLGQYEPARVHYERALATFRRIGDRTGEGRTHNNIGLLEQRLDRPGPARNRYHRALDIARDVGNRTGAAVALVNLADLDVAAGDLDTARDRYRDALNISRHIRYRVGQADAVRGLGVVLGRLGRAEESVEHLRRAVALCQDAGEYETQVRALHDLAEIMRRTGHADEAVAHYRTALALAVEAGDEYTRTRTRDAIAAEPALHG